MNAISATHYRWFCIIGLALIVSSVFLLFKESFPKWKFHQWHTRQEQLTRLQAEIDRLSASVSSNPLTEDNLKRLRLLKAQLEQRGIKVQQVVLDSLNRIDRCTSCHIGIEDKRLHDLKAPYKSHSGKYLVWHPVEKFGCTVCHEGQGLATTFMDAAHGEIKHWDKPLTKKELLQASCGKCHLGMEVPESSLVSKGREVIEKWGCFGCHKIPLFEGYKKPGPSLDKLGSKVNKNWLVKWLSNPRNYLEKPKMPKINLSQEDIDLLSDYLMGSKDGRLLSKPEERGDPEMGKVRFRESRCVTCHSVNGKGGTLAPELGNIVSKVNKEWLFRFIKDPHHFQPKTKMPRYNFSDREALDITEYIMEEFSAYEEMEEGEEELASIEPRELSPELIKKAEGMFIDYGCSGCHDRSGIKGDVKIGPELYHIGSKDLETIDFGNVKDVVPSLPNWIFLKLKNPRAFDERARMGDYNLSDEEAVQITFALLSFTKEKIPRHYTVSYQKKGHFSPQGEIGRLFDKYRCLSCHQVAGEGGTLSTVPLDMEGSQVKRDWLFNFLKVPYPIRVHIPERMLRLWLSDKEAELLTDYMCTVFVDDSIPDPPQAEEETLKPEDTEKGRALFDKYGCIACHIVGSDGGYVGPQFNNVGDRLKAGWIFAWLKNPQKYKPKTLQPNYGFSDDEARALTAYLANLTKEGGKKVGVMNP